MADMTLLFMATKRCSHASKKARCSVKGEGTVFWASHTCYLRLLLKRTHVGQRDVRPADAQVLYMDMWAIFRVQRQTFTVELFNSAVSSATKYSTLCSRVLASPPGALIRN